MKPVFSLVLLNFGVLPSVPDPFFISFFVVLGLISIVGLYVLLVTYYGGCVRLEERRGREVARIMDIDASDAAIQAAIIPRVQDRLQETSYFQAYVRSRRDQGLPDIPSTGGSRNFPRPPRRRHLPDAVSRLTASLPG